MFSTKNLRNFVCLFFPFCFGLCMLREIQTTLEKMICHRVKLGDAPEKSSQRMLFHSIKTQEISLGRENYGVILCHLDPPFSSLLHLRETAVQPHACRCIDVRTQIDPQQNLTSCEVTNTGFKAIVSHNFKHGDGCPVCHFWEAQNPRCCCYGAVGLDWPHPSSESYPKTGLDWFGYQ